MINANVTAIMKRMPILEYFNFKLAAKGTFANMNLIKAIKENSMDEYTTAPSLVEAPARTA